MQVVMIEGRTALFFDLRNGHYECMDMLLEAGADVNITDNYGNTSLHIEMGLDCEEFVKCLKNYHQSVKRLLRAGININIFNTSEGKNVLEIHF